MAVDYETPYGPRPAVAAWLRASDIDPGDVPIEGPIAIDEGQRIHYAALVRNDEGRLTYDPQARGPKVEYRTVQLKIEPPTNVQVRASI